jgi:hypothetical protein
MQAITTTQKGINMHAQKLHEATGARSLSDYPVNSTDANPLYERQTRFTKALDVLKKSVLAAVLPVLVAGAFSVAIPAVPAYASATALTLTTYPQNSTGVPMVANAVTNHVLRGTPDAVNMFVNGALVLECKSRECATDLGVLPGQTAIVTADVGPRGTVPYTSSAIVSATTTVVVVRHIISCHGTTCI